MSLTSCLHKAKDTMNPDDFDAVLVRTAALEDEGVATPEAERRAIADVLTGVQAELEVATAKPQIETKAFKDWFGDSKVVDAQGKPLVMYHGTAGDFSEFNTRKSNDAEGRKLEMGWGKDKMYFTSSSSAASSAAAWAQETRKGAAANVMPVYLKIKNPIDSVEYMQRVRAKQAAGSSRDDALDAVYKEIKREGIDGIVSQESGAYATFKPEQIKSATGNNGDFDPTSKDITRSASREDLLAGADAIKAMTEDERDNLEPAKAPGAGWASYVLYEARKLMPKASDKLKKITERNSFILHHDNEYLANVDGALYGVNKWEDPDATGEEDEGKEPFVYAYSRLDHPGFDWTGTMTGDVAELIALMRASRAKDGDIKQSTARPMFTSQLQTAIEGIPDRLATMAAPQWKLWLDANAGKLGVKKEEVEWSGVKDYLTVRGKDKVTREEVAAYLADNGVKVHETVLGGAITELSLPDEWYFQDATDDGYDDQIGLYDEKNNLITTGDTEASALEDARERVLHELSYDQRTGRIGGGTKYENYTLPGGTNYRELLITLPEREGLRYTKDNVTRLTQDDPAAAQPELFWYFRTPDNVMQIAKSKYGFEAHAKDYILRDKQPEAPAAKNYKSSHWDQKNVLAHIRVDDRTDAEGNKVLFVNEIQSDWGQDGKKKGFHVSDAPDLQKARADVAEMVKRNDNLGFDTVDQAVTAVASQSPGDWDISDRDRAIAGHLQQQMAGRDRVPAAPFVGKTEAWVALALKRAIIMAAQGGYDKVALITGTKAADLYDLSKQVDQIRYIKKGDVYDVWASNHGGGAVSSEADKQGLTPEQIADFVGKDVADKIVSGAGRNEDGDMVLEGVDLKVGGEGMKVFYDSLVPQVAREVLKKIGGGKMEEVVFGGANEENGRYVVVDSSTGETVFRTDSEQEAREYRLAYPEASRIAEMSDDAPSRQVMIGSNPGFTITPAMREKVAGGLPLFSVGRTSTGVNWESPVASKFDDLVYKFQDKQIETKRVVEAIQAASGAIADDLNVYLNEEMFHGRAAKRTEDFVNLELNPMIQEMADNGMTLADVEEFLHARHAQEANAVIAQRNPNEPSLQDGGSGMTNATAASYLTGLTPEDKAKLQAAADKVDAIIHETRKLYVDYELESQEAIDAWDGMFKHYIPLQREDKTASPGIGQGFSIKGKETKGRTGSTRKVVDILANVAMQRERAIVRGEKNRVAKSLIGLATANQNPDFWTVDQVPTERVHNPATGLVEERSDPMYKNRDNAVVAKIKASNGAVREHAVVFNEDDPRALRMAVALKNLDATQLEGLLGASAKITRYFAAVNTQYNPVFGVVNLVRDVQGAMLNLTSTPLANDKLKIAKYTGSALKAVYADLRAVRKGGVASSAWASLWEDFQHVGGQTGYRDMFATSADRGEAIQKALDPTGWMDGKLGKVFTANGALKVPLAQAQKQAGFLFDWLSDYNGAMENGVRLAAYKAGLERGMTREQAASVAKNLTTNFNRKGQVSQQAGAMFAFFNAAIQGTARIGQTLFDMEPGQPKTLRLSATGKKIVYGGILLGSVQAMALAAAGFGDEDPPEFTRERSLIIPTGGKTYISIPMPLGMHIIPNLGRVATEFALSGFKDPVKRSIGLMGMFADAFNPIGNAGLSMQTLAPTALDPLVALTENKDWTGRPIAKTSFNKAIPGHTLGRDTSTAIGEFLSEAINTLSGGNEHVAGVFSPTPDQIDYLVGQVTGGVGREYSKVEQSLKAGVRGEALPTYKIPLVGRFVGNAEGQASEGSAFYANVDKLNEIETEAKSMKEDGKPQEARALLASKPEAYLIAQANMAESQARKLRKSKSELIKSGAPREQVKAIEENITAVMARLNRSMEQLEKSKD